MKKGTIIAILRGVNPADAPAIAGALKEEGINYIEVSLSDVENGLASVQALSESFGDSIHLGAGTVINEELVDRAIASGAKYIITPGWDRELVSYSLSKGVDVFPGVFSPGEILQAINLGILDVKLFPAGSMGPKYIKDLSGPFPQIKVMAVGGVSKQNMKEYIEAGCHSFAIGSDLVPRGATKNDLEQIRNNAKAFIQLAEGSD